MGNRREISTDQPVVLVRYTRKGRHRSEVNVDYSRGLPKGYPVPTGDGIKAVVSLIRNAERNQSVGRRKHSRHGHGK